MAADFNCETINPEDPEGPKIAAVFPGGYTSRLFKYSPVDFENLRAAKFVLENTERIFFGVRDFSEGGWCYTGHPATWYIRKGIEVPFPADRVFAVYMSPRMHVYECRAEYIDDQNPLCPVDWQTRYRGLTWPKSTS